MIPSPIHRVLSVTRTHGVASLLMGGQACILYGAAEFSRDIDLAIVADAENLTRLSTALQELEAAVTAVPPFEAPYLERGHAVHFRCGRNDVRGLRIDVMARLRGVDAFPALWARRTTVSLPADAEPPLQVDLLALPDLVAAKKTQRDQDWPMIRRLVEASYFGARDHPTAEHVAFWLRELRTPELLVECASAFPDEARVTARQRLAVARAVEGDPDPVDQELQAEQRRERAADKEYWAPLRAELEALRQGRRAGEG